MRDLLKRLKAVENALQGEKALQATIYLKDGSTLVMEWNKALEYLSENGKNAVSADMVDDKLKNSTMKAVFNAFITYGE